MAKKKQTSFELFCEKLVGKLLKNTRGPSFRLDLIRDPVTRRCYLTAKLKTQSVILTPHFPVGELLDETIPVSLRQCLRARKSLSVDFLIEDIFSKWLRRTGAFLRWDSIQNLEKKVSSYLELRCWGSLHPNVLGNIRLGLDLYDYNHQRSWKGEFLAREIFPQKVIRKICREMRAFARQLD